MNLRSIYDERTLELASYIVKNNATIRDTAQKYGISKSTVHKDISTRLQSIDTELCESVRKVLEKNKSERHLRGGQATKLRFSKARELKKRLECL